MVRLHMDLNEGKVKRVYQLFDSVLQDNTSIILAYSGGKDSTLLALLLYFWLEERGRSDLIIRFIHNDTLSEIPEVEGWARRFSSRYVDALSRLGINSEMRLLIPQAVESFYWRVLIRGYPAPNFKFRWCVWLLKRKPTVNYLKHVGKDAIMLLGLRDDESSTRANVINRRSYGCPLGPSRCTAYYLLQSDDVKLKVTPIRDWSDEDVWTFLNIYRTVDNRLELNELFKLYGMGTLKIRYGCWHCTLVRRQLGHYALGDKHLYYEGVRILYKCMSNTKYFRIPKNKGYSTLGPLNILGRAMLFHLINIAEQLSGIMLYGLDEANVKGMSLREILYELEDNTASEIVKDVEESLMKSDDSRLTPTLSVLRDVPRSKARQALDALVSTIKDYLGEPLIRDYIEELINSLERRIG